MVPFAPQEVARNRTEQHIVDMRRTSWKQTPQERGAEQSVDILLLPILVEREAADEASDEARCAKMFAAGLVCWSESQLYELAASMQQHGDSCCALFAERESHPCWVLLELFSPALVL